MMNHPPLNELLSKVDCRYTLVIEVARRARQLVDHARPLVETASNKPVTIAVQEIMEGKISCDRSVEGAK
ncbi:MAG: DNA-directed RNA polymerase subunit omega [Christensenellales bacterium]|jgi:DNA-directed RNA polymerase subunit omega